MKAKGMTKKELVTAIEEKTRKAKPMVRRALLPSLTNMKRSELERLHRKARVTKSGNISLV